MSKLRLLLVPLAALIVVGLLVGGGIGVYRAGWAQGYAAGSVATGGEEGAMAPHVFGRFAGPQRWMTPYAFGRFAHPGWSVGRALLFGFGTLLFIMVGARIVGFLLMGRSFHPWARRMGPYPPGRAGKHWGKHWHGPHGHGPWMHGQGHRCGWGWEQPPEEEGDQAEPDATTGESAAEH